MNKTHMKLTMNSKYFIKRTQGKKERADNPDEKF